MSNMNSAYYTKMKGIESLPTEILVKEIVPHLDNYGILSLLALVPRLKRYTVLVTDHLLPPMFFEVLGIQRKYIVNQLTSITLLDGKHVDQLFIAAEKHDTYTELFDDRFIKLIEFGYPCSLDYLLKNIAGKPLTACEANDFDKPLIDSKSFVFLRDAGKECDEYFHRFTYQLDKMKIPRSHWEFGQPTHFTTNGIIDEFSVLSCISSSKKTSSNHMKCEVYNEKSPYFVNDPNTLKSLRIEGTRFASFSKQMVFPEPTDLAIVLDSSVDNVPVIRGITAPKLKRFVVHYDGILPIFKDLKFEKREGYDDIDYTVFELVNRGSKISTILSNNDQDAGVSRFKSPYISDYSFIKHFTNLRLKGCPQGLLRKQLPLSSVKHFRWTLCQGDSNKAADLYLDSSSLEMGHLESLNIEVQEECANLPKVNTNGCLQSLSVQVLAPYVKPENLWCREADTLRMLLIYRSTNLYEALGREEGNFNIDLATWKRLTAALESMRSISLVGFDMTFLTQPGTVGRSLSVVNPPEPQMILELIPTVRRENIIPSYTRGLDDGLVLDCNRFFVNAFAGENSTDNSYQFQVNISSELSDPQLNLVTSVSTSSHIHPTPERILAFRESVGHNRLMDGAVCIFIDNMLFITYCTSDIDGLA